MKKTKLTKKEIKDAILIATSEIVRWTIFIKRMEKLLKKLYEKTIE